MTGIVLTVFLIAVSAALTAVALWDHRRSEKRIAELRDRIEADRETLRAARAREEEALTTARVHEAALSDVLDGTLDIGLIYEVTADGKPGCFVHANTAACRKLGFERNALLDKSPADIELFAEPGSQPRIAGVEALSLSNTETLGSQSVFASRMLQILMDRLGKQGQIVYGGRYVTFAGGVLPVEITARRLVIGSRTYVVSTAHDVTDRVRRETDLDSKEKLLRDLTGRLTVGLAVYDGQKRLVSANAACLKMFGFPDNAELERFDLLKNVFLPDNVRDGLRRGNSMQFEFSVDFDEVVRMALCVTGRRGRGYFAVNAVNMGMDEQYAPRGFFVQTEDITRLRETEEGLRLVEQQLRQAQKMEAIGTLAGGIAHDFNNVLTPILGYTDMALEMCPPDTRMRDYLEEVLAASRRARDLVAQILSFSRQDVESRVPMHLAPIVKEVVKQRAAVLPPNIRIQCTIKERNDLAHASPTQLHQILTNLCRNAEHAMTESGGTIEIRLTSFLLTSLHRREFPSLVTREYERQGMRKRYLRLSVRDTGCGMNPETLKRIFDVFFTTKKEGEGTGMGLAVVRGHVASLGGAISVESVENQGSTFHVAIPMAETPAEEVEAAQPIEPGSHERVLFVDDEVSVVRMAERMLESLGYEPVVTSQCRHALDLFRGDPAHFDVIVTDHVMPEMTGTELTREIHKIRPNIPVILCTGFSERVTEKEALDTGVSVYLTKPVERGELAAAIRRALESRSDRDTTSAPHAQDLAPMGMAIPGP